MVGPQFSGLLQAGCLWVVGFIFLNSFWWHSCVRDYNFFSEMPFHNIGNNTTALRVLNNNIQPRRTKAMDMRFHWLRCCEAQRQFLFFWRPGPTNRADYWTKHHWAAHHIEKRPEILTPKIVLEALRAAEKDPEFWTPRLYWKPYERQSNAPLTSQLLSQPSIKPSQFAPAAAAAKILP
jgi:hypothetical protein